MRHQLSSLLFSTKVIKTMTDSTPPAIQLIINADDFGHCSGRNRGIIECYRAGLISSATLMVNAREVEAAVSHAKEYNIPLGLHLNLTEGHVTNRGRCCSLVASTSGVLRGKFGFRKALASGSIKGDELREEIRAQFHRFQELTGHSPTHVDGHQHVHVLPGVREILANTAKEYGILAVRIPIQHGLEECHWLPSASLEFFRDVIQESAIAKDLFLKTGLRTTEGFFGLSTMGSNMTLPTLKSALDTALRHSPTKSSRADPASPLTYELMVHPGYPCQSGCGVEGEDFYCFEDRAHEMRLLAEGEWKKTMSEAGVKLCSFQSII
ncbi:carbohydrate deacetylase-like isoform X2 [Acanthaster planci]|uniref:Carbohydrate deacetylase n=1 Tax=Acanthaster planci TaxID=133434 RepID=A0A8B7Z836_ACAPL|nr:carbohydrate deacetylase-like isoform X2 [Acanthaster planci]